MKEWVGWFVLNPHLLAILVFFAGLPRETTSAARAAVAHDQTTDHRPRQTENSFSDLPPAASWTRIEQMATTYLGAKPFVSQAGFLASNRSGWGFVVLTDKGLARERWRLRKRM